MEINRKKIVHKIGFGISRGGYRLHTRNRVWYDVRLCSSKKKKKNVSIAYDYESCNNNGFAYREQDSGLLAFAYFYYLLSNLAVVYEINSFLVRRHIKSEV